MKSAPASNPSAEQCWDNPRSIQLSERFLITATELADMAPVLGGDGTQQFVFATLCAKLCSQPFVMVGWSASEDYLLNHIETQVQPVLTARSLAADELSVIDISFNDHGHTRLASFYGKDKDTAFIGIQPPNFNTDHLFLWLQALYSVGCLDLCAPKPDKAALAELAAEIQQPPDVPSFVFDWVDNFLPVWVRLCWRCGLVACRKRDYQLVAAEDIDLESRDEHIPWALPAIERPDLTAAARLLAALHRSGNGDQWDFEMFPGGLYRDNRLIVPLPAWNGAPPNDLRGLKPLVDAIKQRGDGYIDRIEVMLLDHDPANAIQEDVKRELKELLAAALAMTRFANGSRIEELELEDL